MKKFVSLLLTAVLLATTLTVFAVPASAEGTPTEVEPNECGYIQLKQASGDYIISSDYTVQIFDLGGINNKNFTLTIAPNVTVTVTNKFTNWGTLNVLGKLNVTSASDKTNVGTINVGCDGILEGTIPGYKNRVVHHYVNGVCENCNAQCPHTKTRQATLCCDCGEEVVTSSASTLSEGNLTIVVGIAAAAVFGVGGFVLGKRKKKTVKG